MRFLIFSIQRIRSVRNPSAQIPCTNCSGFAKTTRAGEVDKGTTVLPDAGKIDEDMKVVVVPNLSNTNFRITIGSNNLKEFVKMIVTDMLGRVIDTRITTAGQIITIGDQYRSGMYAVRIIQGCLIK